MDNMLGVLNRHVKTSLKNIKIAFQRDGFSFNAEFKQYFLRSANKQIEETYDRFETDSMLKDQIYFGASDNPPTIDIFPMINSIYTKNHYFNGIRTAMNGPIEVIDSSDEEDQPGNRFKLESSETSSTIQYGDQDIPPELHDDGSHMTDTGETENETKVAEMVETDGHRGMDPTYDPYALNNKQNVVGGTKSNNIGGSSGKWAESRSTRKVLETKQLKIQKRFKCELCDYSGDTKWLINRHMRTHTGEKPFLCDICRKGFNQLVHMKKHKVTHTEQVPFHCRGCFTGFSQKSDQAAHEKVCKSRRYECHFCKKFITVNKNQLKDHMRKHNGKNPFRCEICMKGFTLKGSLKAHLNNIHARIDPYLEQEYMISFITKLTNKFYFNLIYSNVVKNPKMLNWNDEMNQMLAAFDRQAKCSLANIKKALKREGQTLNANFKQYFLRVSNERIRNSYDEFEIGSMFEDQNNVSAYGITSTTDIFPMMNSIYTRNHDFNGIRNQMDDLGKIIDLSDDEDQSGNRNKMESTEASFGIQYDSHGETFQLNDLFENDDDGSYADEMPETNLIGIDYNEDVSKSEGQDRVQRIAASTVKVDDNIPLIAVSDRKMDSKNKRTSTVTSSEGSKFVDGAKINNTTGRSNGCPKESAELDLNPQSIKNKKSIWSNRMQVKKRLKCRLCEYSSNLMGNINRHMRIHTGDRPYQCDICDKGFTQLHNMKKHKVTHTDEIPFYCRGCFNGFSRRADRETHEKVCKYRRYECHICKKFVNVGKINLKWHMRKHSDEKSF
ncbi:uncharacterized protein LOC116338402 [Contarinia nasturtii]|uniref:uncharacterized protein LOC116338402 n=1 Tax=Contarinia nasturtii TaxID=265458 RepID=UPI0012D3EA1B|nr:uncharacterized protein LOC116338402 [Contarinia nasturtii]